MLKLKVFGLCVNYIICSLDFRYTEAVVRRCSSEQALLKISQCWSFLLIKLQAFRHSEICKIFKSIFFTEHLRWLLLEISYELSLYCIMRMMNRVIVWYVLALQRLFNFIACVSFLSISFSFFFVDFTTCLGIEVSLSILQIKHWSCSKIPM